MENKPTKEQDYPLKRSKKQMCDYDSVLVYEWRVAAIYFAQGCGRDLKQAVAELGHTRITSCQLGQCSDQVVPNRVGIGWYWLV